MLSNPAMTTLLVPLRPIYPAAILLAAHQANFNPHMSNPSFNPELFAQAVDQLFATLNAQQIPYLLVGGIAMLLYVEGRNTQDIDLIISRTDAGAMAQLSIEQENRDFARADYQGVQVDLLLTQNPLFEQVQQQFATQTMIQDHAVPCATPQGLTILKLYALPSLYRQGDFNRAALYETDILQLALSHPIDFQAALSVVAPHLLPSDRSELSGILLDIQTRLERTRRSQNPEPGAF